MSYVAVIGGVVSLGSAYMKSQSTGTGSAGGAGGASGMGGGGLAPVFTSPSAAAYGTTLGNDGWAINFGSGSQTANPTESNTARYQQEQSQSTRQDNQPRLNELQPIEQITYSDAGLMPAGMDTQTLLMLAVGGVCVVKLLNK